MATITYRIRGKSSIYISLTSGRDIKLEANTGFSINPKEWSKVTKRPKQNSEINKITFGHLSKLETFVYDEVNNANSKGELIDINWLKNKINLCFDRVKKTDQSQLSIHIQYIIDNANTRKIKGSNKIGLSENRLKGYRNFKKIIEQYQKVIKKKIHFQDVNKPFVDRFTNWLFNTQKYSTNSAGKILDNLKTVCLDAEKLEIKVNDYVGKIQGFKEQNEDRYIQTLSFKELEQIRTAELETEAQDNARRWLLLGCEIGQRVGDLLKLNQEKLRYKGNNIYIDIIQQKTGKAISVRVLSPTIIDMIENHFPYAISQQKLNKHIKDVCRLAKIEDEVKGKKYDKKSKRKKIGVYPKCDLITSHSFRRSFATNYYTNMPTPVLINITGHSKESLFLQYINQPVDSDHNADLFADFYEKMYKDKEPQLKVIRNG